MGRIAQPFDAVVFGRLRRAFGRISIDNEDAGAGRANPRHSRSAESGSSR